MSPNRERRTHPTRDKLVVTVVELLKTFRPDQISVEQVLEESGVSRGSLYHHFEDFYELLEAAEIENFSTYVDLSIEPLSRVIHESKTLEQVIAGIHRGTEVTQHPTVLAIRFQRIQALSRSYGNERFHKALGREQERLTSALADLVREAQEKGWFRKDLDARAAAVLVQAYTLGKVVDDITDVHMGENAWVSLIDDIVLNVLIQKPAL